MHAARGVFRPSQLPTSRSRPNQALQVWQHDDEECMHAGNEPLAVREREAGMVAFTQFVAHERGGGASGGSEAGVVCRLRELTPSTLSSKPPSRAGGTHHTHRTTAKQQRGNRRDPNNQILVSAALRPLHAVSRAPKTPHPPEKQTHAGLI